MTTHKHKAIPERSTDTGWTGCVTQGKCMRMPSGITAHGGIVRRDVCSCGAYRDSEINNGSRMYGPWIESEDSPGGGQRRG